MLTYKAYSVPKINFSTRNFKKFLKNLVGIRFIYKLSMFLEKRDQLLPCRGLCHTDQFTDIRRLLHTRIPPDEIQFMQYYIHPQEEM